MVKGAEKDYELAIGIQGVSLISSKKTVKEGGQVRTRVLVEARVPYNELNLDQWKFSHNKINVTLNNQAFELHTKSTQTIRQSIESYMIDLEQVRCWRRPTFPHMHARARASWCRRWRTRCKTRHCCRSPRMPSSRCRSPRRWTRDGCTVRLMARRARSRSTTSRRSSASRRPSPLHRRRRW